MKQFHGVCIVSYWITSSVKNKGGGVVKVKIANEFTMISIRLLDFLRRLSIVGWNH